MAIESLIFSITYPPHSGGITASLYHNAEVTKYRIPARRPVLTIASALRDAPVQGPSVKVQRHRCLGVPDSESDGDGDTTCSSSESSYESETESEADDSEGENYCPIRTTPNYELYPTVPIIASDNKKLRCASELLLTPDVVGEGGFTSNQVWWATLMAESLIQAADKHLSKLGRKLKTHVPDAWAVRHSLVLDIPIVDLASNEALCAIVAAGYRIKPDDVSPPATEDECDEFSELMLLLHTKHAEIQGFERMLELFEVKEMEIEIKQEDEGGKYWKLDEQGCIVDGYEFDEDELSEEAKQEIEDGRWAYDFSMYRVDMDSLMAKNARFDLHT